MEFFIRTVGVFTVGIAFSISGFVVVYIAAAPIILISKFPISSWSLNTLKHIWEKIISHPASWKLCLLAFGAGIALGLFQQISMYLRDRRGG